METTNTIVIGAGQAGLALSHHLTAAGHEHVVLERGRVGERWRSERWPSLSLLTPNWLNQLPGAPAHSDRDGFLGRDAFVGYLDDYARGFAAPLEEGVEVEEIRRDGDGYRVRAGDRVLHAPNVVLATGDCDVPAVPALHRDVPGYISQLHTTDYRGADALPGGGVLVVGAGASGLQIAAELRGAGRDVVLAVGRHSRMVRRHRGRDIWHWLRWIGHIDVTIDEVHDPRAARRAPSFGLSGAGQLDLNVLADAGVVLTGHLTGFDGTCARFDDDLAATVGAADERMWRVLRRIEDRIAHAGVEADAPEDVAPVTVADPPRALDLRTEGISTVIWATGYRRAYPWLRVPVLDGYGEIAHRHGATEAPGLHVLGMRFQRKRKSHFIGGVGEDAALLASKLVGRRGLVAQAA